MCGVLLAADKKTLKVGISYTGSRNNQNILC